MNTRYYVTSIEYNEQAKAENRSVPFAFDTLDEARKKYHYILSQDINLSTLGWAVVMIFDNYGNKITSECWIKPVAPTTEEEE